MKLVNLAKELVHKLRNPVVACGAFRPAIGDKKSAIGNCRNRCPFRHKIGIGLARKLGRQYSPITGVKSMPGRLS